MKALIKKDVMEVTISHKPGRTRAEKLSCFYSCHSWQEKLEKIAGKWVTIDTKFLFDDQFNVVEEDGNLRIYCYQIEKLDITPEFTSINELMKAIQERYTKDWPGTIISQDILNLEIIQNANNIQK